MFVEYSGNTRSTPSPNEILRTVKDAAMVLPPDREMQTPS
jgi:hypothetical protein